MSACPDSLFMDVNVLRHRTAVVEEFFQSEDIQRMDWPVRSSELNFIEHVWDLFERRLSLHDQTLATILEIKLVL